MHISSLDNLRYCLKRHVMPDPALNSRKPLKVLELLPSELAASGKKILDCMGADYSRVVITPRKSSAADLPLQLIPLPESTFDIVFSSQASVYGVRSWDIFMEMCRIAKPNGIIILFAPSSGRVDQSSMDSFRFLPSGMPALADHAGVTIVENRISEYGPLHELVAVFRKSATNRAVFDFDPDLSLEPSESLQNEIPENLLEAAETGAGNGHYLDFLKTVHQKLKPDFYLEIGVATGQSLRFAECEALGIDPAPNLDSPLAPHQRLNNITSDDFFNLTDVISQIRPIDLAYIDGMHLIEYALKDFMNIEKYCHAHSIVMFDDIYPAHPLQSTRTRQSKFWTGDIWKIIPILQTARPDLILLPVDTEPTGTLLVIGLDPDNRTLWNEFDTLAKWAIEDLVEPTADILQRTAKFSPNDPLLQRILNMLLNARRTQMDADIHQHIRQLMTGSLPRQIAS